MGQWGRMGRAGQIISPTKSTSYKGGADASMFPVEPPSPVHWPVRCTKLIPCLEVRKKTLVSSSWPIQCEPDTPTFRGSSFWNFKIHSARREELLSPLSCEISDCEPMAYA